MFWILASTLQVIAEGCTSAQPYKLSDICYAQCVDGTSLIDAEGNCLTQCNGQTSETTTDSNGNKVRTCTACPDDRPFHDNSGTCLSECPSTKMADQNNKCLDSCNYFRVNQVLTNSAGNFSYILCMQCSTSLPFFDFSYQNCTNNCNSLNITPIYVNSSNYCVESCVISTQQVVNGITINRCTVCDDSTPFINNNQCSNTCPTLIQSYALVSEDHVCISECQGSQSLQIVGDYSAYVCTPCGVDAPFWNGFSCSLTCDQTYNGYPIVNENLVCQECSTSNYLNKRSISSTIYYKCTSSCPTNTATNNGSIQICQTCAEISLSEPVINSVSCTQNCSQQINYLNAIDEDNYCVRYFGYSQGNLLPRNGFDNPSSLYYVVSETCPSGQQLNGSVTECTTCLELNQYEDLGKCTQQCPNNLVDQSGICRTTCESNEVRLTNGSIDVCLPKCNYYVAGSTLQCVTECDPENVIYYGNGIAYCLPSCSTGQLRVQTTENISQYLNVQCQTITSCQSGYYQIRDTCLKMDNCSVYNTYCTSTTCGDYSYETNGVCDYRCIGNSYPDENKVCTACGQNQYVNSNNECVETCESFIEDGKCVTSCTIFTINNTYVTDPSDQNVCVTSCDGYLYRDASNLYYTCQNDCNTQNYYRNEQYIYNSQTLNARVCTSACNSSEGTLGNADTIQQCLICSTADLVNYNNVCVETCPSDAIYNHEGYCAASCPAFVYNDTYCYNSCQNHQLFVGNGNTTCVDRCLAGENQQIDDTETYCVTQCQLFVQESICVDNCSVDYPFVLDGQKCTLDCDHAGITITDINNICLTQCAEMLIQQQLGVYTYYVCAASCDVLNLVQYGQDCYTNCATASSALNTTLYRFNTECVTECPSRQFRTDATTGELICTGLSDAAKLGIGLGVFFGVLIIVAIGVGVGVGLYKHRNKLFFKYPLPASPTPTAKPLKSPVRINLRKVQDQLSASQLTKSGGDLNADALAVPDMI